jgi:outer membrane receptor protein involved in Fe transport
LHDRLGTVLDGSHSYALSNPAVGATYAFAPAFSLYGGYAQANRARRDFPAPIRQRHNKQIFVGDPALKQVVAHTYEAGLRGEHIPYKRDVQMACRRVPHRGR